MNLQIEALGHYQKALKQGRKTHRDHVHKDNDPYLQVLDDILKDTATAGRVDLGVIEIPTEKIVGTKTRGRTNSFSSDFMPLLGETSEFAVKWRELCAAHLGDEGIRDPIRCYEYLGRFYVMEGNKRVSVLKYFGASTIPGHVIRILPHHSSEMEIRSYPIFGVPAGINAFALGVQLTNPRARIELKWACVPGNPLEELKERGIDTVSALDIPMPGWEQGNWGTFRILADGKTELLASHYWDWGVFYVKLVRSILSGDWDDVNTGRHSAQAVNYWWGMSSGVIGLELTKALPAGVEVLAQILKQNMSKGILDPFYRCIVSQDGIERNDGHTCFTPDELLQMDWLCENVDGYIPAYDELSSKSKHIVSLQGIYRDTIPPEKEGILL